MPNMTINGVELKTNPSIQPGTMILYFLGELTDPDLEETIHRFYLHIDIQVFHFAGTHLLQAWCNKKDFKTVAAVLMEI